MTKEEKKLIDFAEALDKRSKASIAPFMILDRNVLKKNIKEFQEEYDQYGRREAKAFVKALKWVMSQEVTPLSISKD